MVNAWTVVKVGGSLYEWPGLRERLNAWLAELDARHVLLFPGGGLAADAICKYDQAQQLGEEASHWLALRALALNARFLQTLVPDAELVASSLDPRVESANAPRVCILDPLPFFQEDESRPDPLPHAWHVTSDSLAVRAAKLLRARELILLKSIVFDGVNWQAASERGVVDRYFVQALAQLSEAMRVRIACLRDD